MHPKKREITPLGKKKKKDTPGLSKADPPGCERKMGEGEGNQASGETRGIW